MVTIDRPRKSKRSYRSTLRLETIEPRLVPAVVAGVNVAGFADSAPPVGNSGAVGPNHFVQFANSAFTVFEKNGNQVLQQVDTLFWTNAGISSTNGLLSQGLAQPRVLYDHAAQHWFAIELTLQANGNSMLVARSNTNDPTAGWKAVSYVAAENLNINDPDDYFANFPSLAVDANRVYIGTGNFPEHTAGALPNGSTISWIPKGDLTADTPTLTNKTTVTQQQDFSDITMGWSPQGVTNFGNSATGTVIATDYTDYNVVNFWQITGNGAGNSTYLTPTRPNIGTTSLPANSRQPNGSRNISGGDDDRYTGAIYQVGNLIYAAHPISVDNSGNGSHYDPFFNTGTHNAIQLLVIRASDGAVLAQANYFNANYDYTFGSLAANEYGDIVMGLNRSGNNASGNLGAFAVHARINPTNPTAITFLQEIQLQAGLANNYDTPATVTESWGPYSATSLDPINKLEFWTTQQYVFDSDEWGTRVIQLFVSPRVSSVTSDATNREYGLGEQIPIKVTFNGNVKVTGTPRLLLNSGGTAFYSGGTGTNELTFLYTVGTGEIASDLDYTSTAALQLNGGTINLDVTTAAVAADLTLASPGATGSLGSSKDISVNAIVPVVTSVTTTASDGTYDYGDVISITINFDRDAVVVGVPQLALNSGGIAYYSAGTTTSSLTFLYTVGAGESSSDLDYLSSAALTLPSGVTIKDELTNGNAVLTLPSPAQNGSLSFGRTIVIDALPPVVNGVNSPTADGTYHYGETISIEATFNKNVQVTGSPRLLLNSGGFASYFSTFGSVVTFHYTVGAGESTLDLNYTSTTALQLNGGSIVDASSPQGANLTLPAPNGSGSLGSNKNIVIDALPPKVTGVSSPLNNGTYHFGDVIPIEVTFDKTVQVSGPNPSLTLNSGGSAGYVSTNGLVLTFNYLVGAGQSTPDLNYSSTTSLILNGGTITEVSSGQNANLTLPSTSGAGSLGTNKNIVIDTTQAHVTSVTTAVGNGTYIVDAIIDISVNFDQAVTVSGSPRLILNSGGFANYLSGSGTSTLLFRYLVAAGDYSADLDYTNASALDLNGGTIEAAGQAAILALPTPGTSGSLSFANNIVVDGIIPQLVEFRVLFGSKSYNLLGATRFDLPWRITGVQAVFSEPIVTGSRLSLSGLTSTSFVGKNTTTLTWKFTAKVKGSFDATLADSGVNALKDSSGNPISAFTSSFKVLYGDFDDNGVVNAADEAGMRAYVTPPNRKATNYNIFADLSGDGLVNLIDFSAARSRRGQSLI